MLNVKINMNGDAAGVLKDQLQAAHAKVQEALDAVNCLTIHGRNYQTLNEPREALREDADAVLGHIVNLHELLSWLTESWLAIDEQIPRTGD